VLAKEDITIVVSAPRSGSTWLGTILGAHPHLDVRKDDTGILYLVTATRTLNPWASDGFASGSPLDRARIDLVSAYYGRHRDGKLVLVSPTNATFLPLLRRVFPYARYIHLQRGPLDTIASFKDFLESRASLARRLDVMRKKGSHEIYDTVLSHLFHALRWLRFRHSGYLGVRPAGFHDACDMPRLEFLCWYYAAIQSHIREGLADVPADLKYELSYEDLVLDYEMELRGLLTFMGVEVREQHIEETSTWVRTKPVGRHKRTFSEEETAAIGRCLTSLEGQADVCTGGSRVLEGWADSS
jgi:hypothetical protein